MAKKFEMSATLKNLVAQELRKQGSKQVTMSDFSNHGITNINDSIYEQDTILRFPDEIIPGIIGFDTFVVNGRTAQAPYVWVDAELNGKSIQPKKLFISQLVRSVSEYTEEDGDFVRGDDKHSDTELYNKLSAFRNAGDILSAVLGKSIQCVKHITGKTARYQGGTIVGLRDFSLACFDEVKS